MRDPPFLSTILRGTEGRACATGAGYERLFCPLPSYHRSHGVMVSTLDFESSDPSSNLGGTSLSQTFISFFCFCFCLCCLLLFFFFIVLSCFPFTAFHYPHVWLKILKKVINGRLDRETTGFILIGIFKRASSFRKETKIWTIPFLPPPCYKQVLKMKKKKFADYKERRRVTSLYHGSKISGP